MKSIFKVEPLSLENRVLSYTDKGKVIWQYLTTELGTSDIVKEYSCSTV